MVGKGLFNLFPSLPILKPSPGEGKPDILKNYPHWEAASGTRTHYLAHHSRVLYLLGYRGGTVQILITLSLAEDVQSVQCTASQSAPSLVNQPSLPSTECLQLGVGMSDPRRGECMAGDETTVHHSPSNSPPISSSHMTWTDSGQGPWISVGIHTHNCTQIQQLE